MGDACLPWDVKLGVSCMMSAAGLSLRLHQLLCALGCVCVCGGGCMLLTETAHQTYCFQTFGLSHTDEV